MSMEPAGLSAYRPMPRSLSTCPRNLQLDMISSAAPHETVFSSRGHAVFWATAYDKGRFSRSIALRDAGTGRVLLTARSFAPLQRDPRHHSWEVRAENGELIVSVRAKERKKYGSAQFKLRVFSAYRSLPSIKVKPDLEDPHRLVFWSMDISCGEQKAEDGEEMAEATYSSFSPCPYGAGSRSSSLSSGSGGGGGGWAHVRLGRRHARPPSPGGSTGTDESAVAAEDTGPGDCRISLHPRANSPLVCILMALHRYLLAPRAVRLPKQFPVAAGAAGSAAAAAAKAGGSSASEGSHAGSDRLDGCSEEGDGQAAASPASGAAPADLKPHAVHFAGSEVSEEEIRAAA